MKMSDSLFEGAPTREDRSEDVMGEQFVGHGVAWTSTAPLNFVLMTFWSNIFFGYGSTQNIFLIKTRAGRSRLDQCHVSSCGTTLRELGQVMRLRASGVPMALFSLSSFPFSFFPSPSVALLLLP